MHCIIKSPAKINLHLRVLDKRPDGYHNLESIFAALDFSDTLKAELTPVKGAFELNVDYNFPQSTPVRPISVEKNLITKAVDLFKKKTGFNEGIKIHLEKKIPIGSGLGGGSSNAASALLAMNLLSSANLGLPELPEMALVLGSDVPFFLKGGAAYVSGRGESIEYIAPPSGSWVLLIKPPFSVNTAAAFANLDAYRQKIMQPNDHAPSKKALINALLDDPGNWPYYNDFLPVFPKRQIAVYKEILKSLKEAGASFAGLSGSGSCCFGLFPSEKDVKDARISIKTTLLASKIHLYFCECTFFLAENANLVLEL